ncbi:hypothetical protein ANO14919_061030 [Xylariales sp. No.14919]|nr:hypothetical protein ANO14919_061030 [Xylariales sp. No.14919]
MDSLNAILSYPLFGCAEQQHHAEIAPDVTARVGSPSSESGDTAPSCDATNGDGGPIVVTVPAYRMRILSQSAAHNSTNVERKDQEARKPLNILNSISPQIGINTYQEPQACALASPHKAGYYHCATQMRADGAARVQIGVYGYIPRWRRGATIPYVVLAESFEKPDHARFTAARAAEAITMWKGIGVKFEQVPRNHPAAFAILYLDLPLDNRPDIYAEAFFPHDGPGTLLVYGLALQAANRPCLANLLAHEIGHILGLRHSFAGDICKETGEAKEQGSVLWGARNESSVMNYFTDPKRYSVQEQDLEELRSFYDFTGEKYKGLEICDFTPGSFLFQ